MYRGQKKDLTRLVWLGQCQHEWYNNQNTYKLYLNYLESCTGVIHCSQTLPVLVNLC